MSSQKVNRKRQMASATAKADRVEKHKDERHSVKVTMTATATGWEVETQTKMAWAGTWKSVEVEQFTCEMEAIFEMNKVQARFSKMGWHNAN